MQSSLSLVYDREMGSMRILLISPLPRWWILFSKIIASTIVSMLQVYIFLMIAYFYGITFDLTGYITVAPALLLGGMMLGALGLVLSSLIKQLENFAGVMNFVIFPMFFLSSALYPLWKMAESSELLYTICSINPFTYVVELIRFSLFVQLESSSTIIVFACSIAFLMIAIWGYDPQKGFIQRKT
jgi:ABC-2 type transport system permease protein